MRRIGSLHSSHTKMMGKSSRLKHQSRLGEHIFKQNVEKAASNAEDWLAALFSYKNDGEK